MKADGIVNAQSREFQRRPAMKADGIVNAQSNDAIFCKKIDEEISVEAVTSQDAYIFYVN